MSEAIPETPETGNDEFGIAAVRELLGMLKDSDITELLIERNELKLHFKRGSTVPHAPMQVAAMPQMHSPILPFSPLPTNPVQPMFQPQAEAEQEQPVEMPAGHTILSPMVGTYYSAPSPKDPAFVQEGDEIHAGDSVGIVEAMKMMNEIESEVSGRVARILVTNAQPVEYGQPLMVIEPL
jgi:acetyl-CoA carboxylase biotin carboxyl carrier protein